MSRATLRPAAVTLQPGSFIYHRDKEYIVRHILDLSSLLAKNVETGEVKRLEINEISVAPINDNRQTHPDLESIPDERWEIAQTRFDIIRPLLSDPQRTRAKVQARAVEFGKHTNSLYAWIKLYEECGTLTVLMPQERSDKGQIRVDSAIEQIIQKAIDEEYLTRQQKSPVKVYEAIQAMCKNAGLKPPHSNTIRNRLNALPESLKIHRRRGAKAARDKFEPTLGQFPGADYPYSVVQIDHTPLDIITVDDVHRMPLDRPYLTLAIDVFSRMISGFHISYDPPSAVSVGLCLSQAILPKDLLLAEQNVSGSWPCWGIPRTVHADNAKEFRGAMLSKACQQYDINLEWRPVARPNFGGHIERLLGTVAKEIHTLPGTTFSNIQQKGEYNSVAQSALTLAELERWLLIYITGVYHQRFHSGIQCSPLKKYEEGIFGTAQYPGSGLPPKVADELRLRLDFIPFVERTVQDYGLLIDDIFYFSDVLRRWINATVPGKSKLKQKFIVRRDPRNISCVWFFDPELQTYFEIPYRNNSHPSINIWELRAIKKYILEKGLGDINEDLIFSSYEEMNRVKTQAEQLTKKERKSSQKKRSNKPINQAKAKEAASQNKTESEEVGPTVVKRQIKPFDDLEDL